MTGSTKKTTKKQETVTKPNRKNYRRLGGTGGELSGGVKNPFAVIPTASTPDPVPFLVVPLPIDMLPFLPPGPPPTVVLSTLIMDFALPTVPCKFPPRPLPLAFVVVCND